MPKTGPGSISVTRRGGEEVAFSRKEVSGRWRAASRDPHAAAVRRRAVRRFLDGGWALHAPQCPRSVRFARPAETVPGAPPSAVKDVEKPTRQIVYCKMLLVQEPGATAASFAAVPTDIPLERDSLRHTRIPG